jgi:hypothetical protein
MKDILIIEKGIDIPPRGGKWINLLRSMEIGDSILITDEKVLASTLYITANRIGIKLTTRQMPDGLRVWRVA